MFSDTLGLLKIFLDTLGLSQDTMVLTLEQIPGMFKWMQLLFQIEITFIYLPIKNS